MSAPTPAPGDSSPTSGYYPDPSIPGYIRYWNGAAWVPGTSRPAPAEGEPMPDPPGGQSAEAQAAVPEQGVPGQAASEQQVAPAEETGPMFLDEDPAQAAPAAAPAHQAEQGGARPEPASAWQADAARQTGFTGTPDARVSWGAQGQEPAEPPAAGAPAPGVHAEGTVAIRAVQPGGTPAPESGAPAEGGEQPPADRTMMVGRLRPPGAADSGRAPAQSTGQAPAQPTGQAPGRAPGQPEPGTMAIRALPTPGTPGTPGAPAAPQQPAPQSGYGYPQQAPGQASGQPAPGGGYGYPQSPMAPGGPGGGAASWPQQAQQSQQQPGPGADGPVTPFKPVANDPFLAAAQAQAAARPGALGKRLAARLIDTLALAVVVGGAAFPFIGQAVDHIDGKIEAARLSGEKTTVWLLDGTTAGYLGIVLAVLLLFGVLYEVLPTSKWGWTPGKKALNLEVRDIEEHAPPTFGAALRRWLVYSLPGVLVIGVVGVLWCVFDRPWRQCWHDKAARTFVAG